MKKTLLIPILLSSLSFAGGDFQEYTYIPDPEIVVPVEPVKLIEVITPTPEPTVIVPVTPTSLPFYVSVGLIAAEFTPNCDCPDTVSDKTAGAILKAGYDITDNVSIEGRAIQTNWFNNGGKVKHLGLFAKPNFELNEYINPYALLGYGKTTTQGDNTQRVDASGFSWGLGIDSPLTESLGLFVDYQRLLQKSDSPDLNTIAAGLNYHF